MWCLVVVLCAFHLPLILSREKNPCPDLFKYLPNQEQGKWHGEIDYKSPDDLIDGVFLVVVLDRPTITVGSDFGQQVIKRNPTEYLLRNLGYVLRAGQPLRVKFFVQYDVAGGVPEFKGYRVNGREVCPDPESKNKDEDGYITSKPDYSAVQSQTSNPSATSQWSDNRNQNAAPSCGTVTARPVGLIANGKESLPGEWPWHAALFKFGSSQASYICGGTLISEQHVLTAAHCVTKRPTSNPVEPLELGIFLGKTNLRYVSENDQQRDVQTITVHPDFSHSNLKNDISILKLTVKVQITDFVRPICLWREDDKLTAVVGRLGTVVGWGLDENKKTPQGLRQVEIPVVSTVTCILSNSNFFSSVVWEKNYCAGFTNATSICNGDSGGGMYFKQPGTSNWQLRGLVSIGVGNPGATSVCESNDFTVFTDAAKYSTWIKSNML